RLPISRADCPCGFYVKCRAIRTGFLRGRSIKSTEGSRRASMRRTLERDYQEELPREAIEGQRS
ncbi:hypothetical protein COCCADRAFT_94267, partial [Bipolaris zeicola 26-R-13]